MPSAKRKKYSRYIKNDFFNRLFMTFFTKRKSMVIIISGILKDIISNLKKEIIITGKYILLPGQFFFCYYFICQCIDKTG